MTRYALLYVYYERELHFIITIMSEYYQSVCAMRNIKKDHNFVS